jgi:hypothetical protein
MPEECREGRLRRTREGLASGVTPGRSRRRLASPRSLFNLRPVTRKLTPQQKKQLSYELDRRNAYGANDKASRKAIPLHKRKVVRAYRKVTKQRLPKNAQALDSDAAEAAELSVLRVRPKEWRKFPDIPLGEFIQRQRTRSANRHGRRASPEKPDEAAP